MGWDGIGCDVVGHVMGCSSLLKISLVIGVAVVSYLTQDTMSTPFVDAWVCLE
jgi:hypothetical protein